MNNVKIKLSYQGIGEMLRGAEMAALVEEYGSAAAVASGYPDSGGYYTSSGSALTVTTSTYNNHTEYYFYNGKLESF